MTLIPPEKGSAPCARTGAAGAGARAAAGRGGCCCAGGRAAPAAAAAGAAAASLTSDMSYLKRMILRCSVPTASLPRSASGRSGHLRSS
jgi:hypothetical protein